MIEIREIIIDSIQRIADENELKLIYPLSDESILLESGLDSLGFAILVADLEGTLGYDPFVMMAEPVYPKTLGEFISIYGQFYKVEAES